MTPITTTTLTDQDKDRARRIYTQQFEHSTIQDTSSRFPIFDYDELTLGPVLGRGGFCVVSEIRAFDVTKAVVHAHVSRGDDSREDAPNVEASHDQVRSTALDPDAIQGRQFIADHCVRDGTDARYAIKLLRQELTGEKLVKGLADLAVEAHILSAIEHTNIVKLRATSAEERYDPFFFIVLDRLYDTLEKRIGTWTQTMADLQPPQPNPPANSTPPPHASPNDKAGGALGCCGSKAAEAVADSKPQEIQAEVVESPGDVMKRLQGQKKLLEERLVAVYDLASAIDYLHRVKNIVYRDIKPENAAFDVRGDIKLFDFGTSKELPPQNRKRDLTFKLTGVTGSLPYMAPEVAKTEPYNHKCDTFSFAIMLWRIMALEMPFAEYEKDLHWFFDEVHCGPHKRPNVPASWPLPIQLCVQRGWSHNPPERMEMEQMVNILKKEIVRLRGGNSKGLEHNVRRSTYVWGRRQSGQNSG